MPPVRSDAPLVQYMKVVDQLTIVLVQIGPVDSFDKTNHGIMIVKSTHMEI